MASPRGSCSTEPVLPPSSHATREAVERRRLQTAAIRGQRPHQALSIEADPWRGTTDLVDAPTEIFTSTVLAGISQPACCRLPRSAAGPKLAGFASKAQRRNDRRRSIVVVIWIFIKSNPILFLARSKLYICCWSTRWGAFQLIPKSEQMQRSQTASATRAKQGRRGATKLMRRSEKRIGYLHLSYSYGR